MIEQALTEPGTWRPKILIVEDNPTDVIGPFVLTKQLGLNVALAFNGEQALELLRTTEFDIMILDWGLPGMSGLQLLDRAETARRRGVLKVIVHSGSDLDLTSFARGERYCIVDFWRKPFSVLDMARRMKWLREIRGGA